MPDQPDTALELKETALSHRERVASVASQVRGHFALLAPAVVDSECQTGAQRALPSGVAPPLFSMSAPQAHTYKTMRATRERKLEEKLNYMHNNPVKRGLVRSPGDWPWSSWRFYFLQDASILRMDRLG